MLWYISIWLVILSLCGVYYGTNGFSQTYFLGKDENGLTWSHILTYEFCQKYSCISLSDKASIFTWYMLDFPISRSCICWTEVIDISIYIFLLSLCELMESETTTSFPRNHVYLSSYAEQTSSFVRCALLQETHWLHVKSPRGYLRKIPVTIYNIELFGFAFSYTTRNISWYS